MDVWEVDEITVVIDIAGFIHSFSYATSLAVSISIPVSICQILCPGYEKKCIMLVCF